MNSQWRLCMLHLFGSTLIWIGFTVLACIDDCAQVSSFWTPSVNAGVWVGVSVLAGTKSPSCVCQVRKCIICLTNVWTHLFIWRLSIDSKFLHRELMHVFVIDCPDITELFTYERSWCLGDSRGVVIRGLRVNLWVTVRTVFRLYVYAEITAGGGSVSLWFSPLSRCPQSGGADRSNDVTPERLHSSKLKVWWFTRHFCVFCYQTGQFHPDCLDISSWVLTPVSSSRYKLVLLLFDL